MSPSRQPGFGFWWSVAVTAAEMSIVIPLRLMRIAQGGAKAQAETHRMWSEKSFAFFEAQAAILRAMMGGQGGMAMQRAFTPYRRRVRANRRRLTPR